MSDHTEEDYEGGDAACHDIVAKLKAELGKESFYARKQKALRIDATNKLEQQLAELRLLVAKYMASEGCGCCEGSDHREQRDELCIALDFPPYEDGSGYDYFIVAEEQGESNPTGTEPDSSPESRQAAPGTK